MIVVHTARFIRTDDSDCTGVDEVRLQSPYLGSDAEDAYYYSTGRESTHFCAVTSQQDSISEGHVDHDRRLQWQWKSSTSQPQPSPNSPS